MLIQKFNSHINFKGYDAVPLKAIHLEQSDAGNFRSEMQKIAKKEKFKIQEEYDYNKWIQDNKFIIEKNDKTYLLADNSVTPNYINNMISRCNMKFDRLPWLTQGGNCFIGKLPNGEKYVLHGDKNRYITDRDYNDISEKFGVKKENIFFIPQPDFHIDLRVRPIGYPYVLVNDPSLVIENMNKLDDGSTEFAELKEETQYYYSDKSCFEICDDIINKLQGYGFKPIRVAGVYNSAINFMNAIVNKHQDGTISYITNSSKSNNKGTERIQEQFIKDLKSKVQNIDKFYFVKGNPKQDNYMMDTLRFHGGGIHCMTLEEPDFEAWV